MAVFDRLDRSVSPSPLAFTTALSASKLRRKPGSNAILLSPRPGVSVIFRILIPRMQPHAGS